MPNNTVVETRAKAEQLTNQSTNYLTCCLLDDQSEGFHAILVIFNNILALVGLTFVIYLRDL